MFSRCHVCLKVQQEYFQPFFFLFILFYFIYVMDVINVDPMSNFHMKWNACTSYGDMQEIRLRDQ